MNGSKGRPRGQGGNSTDPARRRAFSLIEVLVVIFCIGLLLALILPAVQASRESARRVRCVNNLRQFGLALHTYAGSVGVLPSGQNGRAYSLHAMLLPQLELQPLYNSINFQLPLFPHSTTALLVDVQLFLCPSDPIYVYDDTKRSYVHSWSHYAGCAGNGMGERDGIYNGLFPGPTWLQPRHIALGDVRDGTSNTVAMSEWLIATDGNPDRRRTKFETVPPASPTPLPAFAARCRSLSGMRPFTFEGHKGFPWTDGHMGMTLYNHTLSINDPTCVNWPGSDPLEAISAGSQHPGGSVALFADGQVRFVRDSIDVRVWRALGTRRGNELISSDSF